MSQEQNDLINKINEKYNEQGQDPNVYLEGLLWSKPITYWDWAEVDTLLSLQKTRTTLEDENVFIMYHQVNELLFKMILTEIRQIAYRDECTPEFFSARLYRISRYFDVLSSSFNIMQEGMEIEQYMKFRNTLTPASGFQSGQYRMIEICSTEFNNLIDARYRSKFAESDSFEDRIEYIYWQAAGKDHKTGEKSLTLTLFEEKYRQTFIDLAKEYETVNLWSKYKSLPEETRQNPELIKAMRHLDHTINISWVMAHYHAAKHYLESGEEEVEATGGSDWKKYMHPSYQRRIFFPDVWTEEERANWGKGQPM